MIPYSLTLRLYLESLGLTPIYLPDAQTYYHTRDGKVLPKAPRNEKLHR